MLLHRATLILCAVSAAGLSDDSADFYAQAAADNSDSATADNSTATATFLTEYVESTGARCLDGSPAVYYWRPGTGDGAKKWYLHQQGGGWCETWDDCLGRSKTGLGTSKGYPKTTNLKGGYFDPTPAVNPMMFNWNQVFVRYCDGGSFSGDNETVTTYKGTPLYYRGKRIREAVFDSLIKKHALAQASDLVVSGCSAGGLATFLHTDQYCDALRAVAPGLKCAGLPDSGFFLDYQDPRRHAATVASSPAHPPLPLGTTVSGNYHKGLKWVFTQMNATSGINQDCIAAMRTGGVPTDAPLYLCMFAEHTSPFTHTPLFPMQSTYDSWQTGHVLYYPNTGADVQVLGDNLTQRIHADLLHPHPQSGVFLDSCWHHCGMWDRIRIDGDLVSVAFQKWYEGLGADGTRVPPKRTWAQGKKYKCDACCEP